MEWNNDEQANKKKGMSLSSVILLGIIACIIFIIILLMFLLMNMSNKTTFSILFDGKAVATTKEELLAEINNKTYINISKFANLVGYDYHKGEYKSTTVEEDKCYVEGKFETATFYLDTNKVLKTPAKELEAPYEEYIVEDNVKNLNGQMYASIEAINKAFNVAITETDTYFQCYTLDTLITLYDTNVKGWGYTGITDQSFENKKALLYGYLIVRKDGGLYKIIDLQNTKEYVLARYTSIEFSENMQEFIVTNTSGEVGIIDINGTIKIEPTYEEISVLDKESDLYLVKQSEKYGVVKGQNISIIFPEFDNIGLTEDNNKINNKYLLLDTLIPVCKNEKWGAYDKEGNKVLELEYDGLGYNIKSIEINGVKESVQPVVEIERAKGIVVERNEKYGLVDLKGEILIKIAADAIYAINGAEKDEEKYFILYNGEEINLIDLLINNNKIEQTIDATTNPTENNLTNNTNIINNQGDNKLDVNVNN